MAEYTQEQIDKMIADSKKGLLTEEDVERKVTSEVDRRVQTGIQKGIETQREKWEREFSERAKLSAEELAKKDFESKLSELTAKEKEVIKKANKTDAKDFLTEAGIPKAHYDKFLDMLVTDDADTTKSNVDNFVSMFNTTKLDIETKLKSEMTKITPPSGGDNKTVSKTDFDKMTYSEKVAFKLAQPEMYKQFMK